MDEEALNGDDVEQYLHENPDFARRYFLLHAQSAWVDEWIARKSRKPSVQTIQTVHKASTSSSDNVLKPLRNFLPLTESPTNRSKLQQLYGSYEAGTDIERKAEQVQPSISVLKASDLQTLSEKDLFMQLIRDIANELDIDKLSHKILVNVSLLTKGDRCSLFLVKGESSKRYLVSRLFDVTATSTLEESLKPEGDEIIIPIGVGIAGTTALTGEVINIQDAYKDPRFNNEIDKKTGYTTHSILCMPIKSPDGMIIGIAQLINKQNGDHQFTEKDEEVFAGTEFHFSPTSFITSGHKGQILPIRPVASVDLSQGDTVALSIAVINLSSSLGAEHASQPGSKCNEVHKVFRDYLTFCGIGITNAQLFDLSVREFKRNQALLSLARDIFESTEVVEEVVKRIMTQAQQLLDCERCVFYLVDTEADSSQGVAFAQIFNLNANEEEDASNESSSVSNIYQELARHVVTSQEAMNIVDLDEVATQCNLELDDCLLASKVLKSMLCTPVFNKESKVIGVAQLLNKRNGHPFTTNDDGLLQAFATFCGLGIQNTQMYEKMYSLHTQQALSIELLSYHASASNEEAGRLQAMQVPDRDTLNLTSFALDDLKLNDDETCLAAIRMFLDLDLLSRFKIQYKVFCRWVLTVKKNYRPVTYHNWRHAFNVAQTMYAIYKNGNMADCFTDKEIFVLLVACFCHDLDHRGTNNSFQVKADSPIARLYSTSTMEHHHFNQSLMILNSEANNIFASFSNAEYKEALTILEHAILSTDLAVYFKKRDSFKELVKSQESNWRMDTNSKILRAMMMTACDLSAITKPWPVQRRVAELVASEFFEQGDMERSQLNEEPTPMMDRRKKDELPKMQVGFINFVCMPLYELLPQLREDLKPLLNGIKSNMENWQKLADENTKLEEENPDEVNNNSGNATEMEVKAVPPPELQESKKTSNGSLGNDKNEKQSFEEMEHKSELALNKGNRRRNGSSFCMLM